MSAGAADPQEEEMMTKSQLIVEIYNKRILHSTLVGSLYPPMLEKEIVDLDKRLMILTGRPYHGYSEQERVDALAEVEFLT